MDKSSLCRICLVDNLRTFCLLNTNLQETYERLTGLPFITEDSRPLQVCYICCAKLRNSYNLQTTCLETEELLTEMLELNQLQPIKNVMRLGVEPILKWTNISISPEDVPVDIIIDDNDDDDDVIFCDDNHNLDVHVKVEAMEDSNKRTPPNDTTSLDSTLEDDIEIRSENSLVIDLCTDINTEVTDIHTVTNNNSDVSLVKDKGKTNTEEDIISSNTPSLIKNTAKDNIVNPTNNIKRKTSYDSPRLDISIVKGNIIEEIVNIEYTEPIGHKTDIINVTNVKTDRIEHVESNDSNIINDNPVVNNTRIPASVINEESRKESNLLEKESVSGKNTIEEISGVKNVEPNTPILNIITTVDTITLDSVKTTRSIEEHSLLENDIRTDQNNSIKNIEQVIKHAEPNITETIKEVISKENTEIKKSRENNMKEVIGINNIESLISILDVNTANTVISIPTKLVRVENECSADKENTMEHEIRNAHDQNSSDNTRQIIKTKHVVSNDTSRLDDNTTMTPMEEKSYFGDEKNVTAHKISSVSNPNNIKNIDQVNKIKHVITDATIITRVENDDYREENNTMEHKISSVSNPNKSKYISQVNKTKNVKSNSNSSVEVRNVVDDTTMTAGVEFNDSRKEKNTIEHKMSSVSNSDDSSKNTRQVIESKEVNSDINPTIDVRNIVIDTATTAGVENNYSKGEINSLEESSTNSRHKSLKRSNENNGGQVIKIKHRKPNINPILKTNNLVANTIARLENEITRKEIDSLKDKSSEHKSNTVHTDRNGSSRNVGQVIKIRCIEPKITLIPNAYIAKAVVDTTQIDTFNIAVSNHVSKEKEDSVVHERSSHHTDTNSSGKNIAQVIEIKHKGSSVTTKIDKTKLSRAENEDFSKEESTLNTVLIDTNSPVNNIKQLIGTKHAEPSYTPILANNLEADNIIARVENEISKLECNSLKDNPLYMLMHVALNCASNPNSFRDNNKQIIENTHTTDTTDMHKADKIANNAITQTGCENVETINSLKANSVEHSENIRPVIEIEHTEPNIKTISGDKNIVHNDTMTASAENDNSMKDINALKAGSLENELNSLSNLNKSGKNIRPVIEIKHVEPKIASIIKTDTNNITMIVENENPDTEDNYLTPNAIEPEINKKITQVIEMKHLELNVTPTTYNTTAETTIVKENNTQIRKNSSLENNSLENDINTRQNSSNKNNNQKVICIKHVEKNNQISAFDNLKINNDIAYDINIDENRIIEQKTSIGHIQIENCITNNLMEANMNEIVNDYAVPSDIFRCDDINAVEGNFIGQEVIIDSSEQTEMSLDNIDVNVIQEDTNKDVLNNTNVNHGMSTECPVNSTLLNENGDNQRVITECSIDSASINNDVHSIGHENETTIENAEIKNLTKIDLVNIIGDDINNKICVEIGLKNIENIQSYNNKCNLENIDDQSVEINVVDEIEEKYNIETVFSEKNDVINKKNCSKKDSPSKGIFRQDVMVVLHKMELHGKTSENFNIEAENEEIRKKDHWNKRSTRKRLSSVLKESTHTENTRKLNKKVKFTHFVNKNNKEIDIKPYICNICHKSFILKHHLIEHNRKHTGEKPYKCDICEQRFYYQNVLNNHVATHSGSRPHKCNICGKCYGLKVNLMRHIRVHTCEKPYKCNICGKCFGYKQHLTTHIRIHTGERPFPCHLCPKRFNQRNNLNTHLRSMHPDSNLN